MVKDPNVEDMLYAASQQEKYENRHMNDVVLFRQ
jgi:hypothetical protein